MRASAVQTVAPSLERARFEELMAPGVTSISAEELARLPVVGDRDIVRAATLLPGVAARNDFSSGFNVRGGEADQNLVLLDGIPIYNPFHLGGLFGTFIDAAVRRVDVYTGAFPAEYGGRLSSVLDVRSAADLRPGIHATSDASLLSSSTRLSGATGSGRVSWSLAGRRTYADHLVRAVVGSNDFPYRFDDAQAHGTLQLPRGGALSLTAYLGRDDLNTVEGSRSGLVPGSGGSAVAFDWSNEAIGTELIQPIGATGRIEQRVSLSGFGTHFGIPAESLALAQQLRDVRVSGRAALGLGAQVVSIGYDLSRLRSTYRERLRRDANGAILAADPTGDGDTSTFQAATSGALYAEDSWKPSDRVQVRAGLRGEQAGGWAGVSPRLSARLFLSPDFALTAAAGRYRQWVRAIRNEDLPIRLFDLWVTSDSGVPVSSSTHLVLGVEHWLGASRFVRIEGYGKQFDRLLEQSSTIDPRIRPALLRQFGGTSYGIDVYARQLERAGVSGWLAYSYGVSRRSFEGMTYFPAHDRRHNATLALSWTPTSQYTLGAHVAVASGTPYTGWAGYMQRWHYDPVTSQWTLTAPAGVEDNVVRGPRNGDRLPTYSRIDVSAERLFRVGRALVRPHVSVVNVLNHENVLLYSLDAAQAPPVVRRYVQFPLLPSIGVRAEF
ncbi:MAG: TonB-dependent receptor [Gemmatimonadaceae bacterium]